MSNDKASTVIKKIDNVQGVRFWRQDYQRVIPAFEVFRVVGHNSANGMYYFRSLRNKTILARSYHQLHTNGFVPFLYERTATETA